jgi:hypothetical protein
MALAAALVTLGPRSQGDPVVRIRSDTRAKLVTAIARGRQRLSEIEAGPRRSTASPTPTD